MAEVIEIAKQILEQPICGAIKEVRYVMGIKSVIKNLEKKKSLIEAWLTDANALHLTSQAQCLAVHQLIYVLDEMRDLLDMIATRKLIISTCYSNYSIKKVLALLFSPSLNPVVSAFRDARRVRALIEELDNAAGSQIQLGSMLRPLFGTAINPMKERFVETGPRNSEEVIGRDEDRDNVIRLLLESSCGQENFSVVSIVGIGGMGKTTLAQYVFSDERVQNHFDVTFWVHVPQELIAKDVVRKIVELATNENIIVTAQLGQLMHRLHPILSCKKYLLVIDNIWDHNLHLNWSSLMQQLGFGGPGSRVLTTTRSPRVAKIIGSVAPYMLWDLEEDDSWHLFKKLAFRHGQDSGLLEAIGKEIVRRCPKVPLVIQCVGRHLRAKQTVREWERYKDKLDNLIRHIGFPSALETLKLTYDDLDISVKRCFACFSLFPKGYIFSENELIYLWIALKLVVPPPENPSLVDIANDYIIRFKEEGLLVESQAFKLCGGESLIEMHDLIHDLAILVAEPEYKMVDSESFEFSEKIRHVSFNYSEVEGNFPWSSVSKMKTQLQTLLLVPRRYNVPELKTLTLKGLSKFHRLKVLGLQDAGLEEVPSTIGELKLLGYLDLSGNSLIKKLPNSITKLVNLVFLNLNGCEKLEELPRDLNKLQKLIYLDLRMCHSLKKLPRGLTELVNLRELHLAGYWDLSHKPLRWGNMNDFQKLDFFVARQSSISTNPNDIAVDGKLQNNLMVLYNNFRMGSNREKHKMLEGFQPDTNVRKLEIKPNGGERLPSWIDYLTALEEIEKSKPEERKRVVSSSRRLPHLKILQIEGCWNREYQ